MYYCVYQKRKKDANASGDADHELLATQDNKQYMLDSNDKN